MGIWNYFLAGSGIGRVVCELSARHDFGPPQSRWPELGADGVVVQCKRCLCLNMALKDARPSTGGLHC
jgi:hypothetical protein